MHNNSFIYIQGYHEHRLNKLVDLIELWACKRCHSSTYQDSYRPVHHHGGFLKLISQLSSEDVKNFDWVKCLVNCYRFCEKNSIQDLWNDFSIMGPEIMPHTNRYLPIEEKFFAVFMGIDPGYELKYEKHFNRWIFPLLERLDCYRNDIWVAHQLEVGKKTMEVIFDNKGIDYFPKSHWCPVEKGMERFKPKDVEQYFSVNIGYLPCEGCLGHSQGWVKSSKRGIQGIIPVKMIKELGGRIECSPLSTAGRDHPFVKIDKKIQLEKWLFLYEKVNDLQQFDPNIYSIGTRLANRFHIIGNNIRAKMIALLN